MIRKEVEWLIRISGSALLVFALYKLYSRPLTHSYHDAFLFNHLQIVLWVMLALIMALIVQSFNSRLARWVIILLAVGLLAPYPFAHQYLTTRAGAYFFSQRQQELRWLNNQILGQSLNKEEVYEYLTSLDIRDYEKGEDYVAYWVDRIPEQRDGLIYLHDRPFPKRIFQYPLRRTSSLNGNWHLFTSEYRVFL
jgi:hypothetical protein